MFVTDCAACGQNYPVDALHRVANECLAVPVNGCSSCEHEIADAAHYVLPGVAQVVQDPSLAAARAFEYAAAYVALRHRRQDAALSSRNACRRPHIT